MSSASDTRRQHILDSVRDRQHVSVKSLAIDLQVSEATVRRDLKALADENLVTPVHGGATIPRTRDFSLSSKLQRRLEAKQVIGELAAGLVQDGDQILVDSGTTCLQMAPHLRRRHDVTVVLNSARLAQELAAPGLRLVMLGGQYRPERMDAVGPIAMRTLEQLRGYVLFLGADGLSMDFGVAATDVESADLYRLAVANARETVLLADHSKFASPSMFRIVGWDGIDRVVSDKQPPSEWLAFFAERGIDVIAPADS